METIPKSIIAIAGEPFIAHQLGYAQAQGIRRVIIRAGHLGDPIQDFVGDGS